MPGARPKLKVCEEGPGGVRALILAVNCSLNASLADFPGKGFIRTPSAGGGKKRVW